MEDFGQIEGRVEFLADLVEVTVEADLGIELPLDLANIVLSPEQVFHLLGQSLVLALKFLQLGSELLVPSTWLIHPLSHPPTAASRLTGPVRNR